ncbi:hypothetical protein UB46_41070 [Burkholderiaceae bacterium 16]|nr:hypothetical protein UB46_41070 [Burkholderiaceae bacterium 16]
MAASRWIQYAAPMLLFGSSLLLATVPRGDLSAEAGRRLHRPLAATALLGSLATLGWLPLEVGMAAGNWGAVTDSGMVAAFVLRTGIGQAWAFRAAIALVTAGLALAVPPGRPAVLAASSGLLLATFALSGHAAMHDGTLAWQQGSVDALHLLCAGYWLGALIPFCFFLRALRDARQRKEAANALRRFSYAGHVAVAGVLVTGCVNTALVLDGWPVHWQSPYQALLAGKIAVAALMVSIALVNRYVLVPRLRIDPDGATNTIRRRTIAEVVLGMAALGLVSVFGMLDPV